ncbi:MAG: glutamyl-tRNA reductase [Actinomycetota bacterium]
MTVTAIGLNHRTAPGSVLDQMSLSADRVPKALAEITSSEVVTEAVVLSTCNRTEVYVHAERFHDGFRDVRRALGLLSGLDPEVFDRHLYVHYHVEAVQHLFEVAAGLDSVVLGEHEILGQVARSWETARHEGTAGSVLNLVFQRAVECGKKVRTDTDIGRSTASLSHAAVSVLAERRPTLDGASVLLIGAGEVASSVGTALARTADVSLRVTNRTATTAQRLAAELAAAAIPFDRVDEALFDADIVIAATGAPNPVLSLDALRRAASARPKLILDLALPADLPAGAAEVGGLEICELAEVQAFANRGIEARQAHAADARAVVGNELQRYATASTARQVAPLIGGLHGWADAIREGELDRYAARLANLDGPDREAVEALSRSIVAKILHQPTVTLKDAAGTARGERLAEAIRELFDQS